MCYTNTTFAPLLYILLPTVPVQAISPLRKHIYDFILQPEAQNDMKKKPAWLV